MSRVAGVGFLALVLALAAAAGAVSANAASAEPVGVLPVVTRPSPNLECRWEPGAESGEGTTNRLLVEAAYCLFLNRRADAEGEAYWGEQIEAGDVSPAQLAGVLVDSSRYRSAHQVTPFEALARIEPAASSSEVGGFRTRREIEGDAFVRWVEGSPVQNADWVQSTLVHGTVAQPSQEIHVAYVHLSPGRGMRVSPGGRGRAPVGSWAQEIDADVAVNGNWFGPWDGPAVSGGEVYAGSDHSYTALFGFTEEGDAIVEHHIESNEVVDPRVEEGVSGHPTLVYRGQRTTDFGQDPTFLNRHPRTAIGLDASGDVLILVTVDGRRAGAKGMTGVETAELMDSLGAYDAVMLDGGGSSTMWIAERGVVNRPSGGLRAVGNEVAVYAD